MTFENGRMDSDYVAAKTMLRGRFYLNAEINAVRCPRDEIGSRKTTCAAHSWTSTRPWVGSW